MTSSAPPRSDVPPHQTSASPSALPLHLTQFIGRARELGEIVRLLGETRLLTLTGAGGSGKTRLAREAAARVASGYSHVAWVDLAPLSDGPSALQEIAAALHVPEHLAVSPVEAIIGAVAHAPSLVVLDNCEHMVDACADLVERLLRGCSRLTVLATSREALGISSETAWLVPPLAREEAVQLFVDRARATLPTFALTSANADPIGEICRRLDGIPLAIELAAARVRVLSPEQIVARLNDAFRLLTTGSRTALPRQRTLRGMMDWSYALLSEHEQILLGRLAVFSGSFSLDSAEHVCTGAPLEEEDILDGIAALVDKSLVVMEAMESSARYRLLETVRQYGEEKLAASGELERLRERHARHYLAAAEGMAPHLEGGEDEPGLVTSFGLEHDNLRAALVWSTGDAAHAEIALRFVAALFWYWYGSGHFREARHFIAAALAHGDNAHPLLRGRALAADGLTGLARGEYVEALQAFEAALELERAYGEPMQLALVLAKAGATYCMLGDHENAKRAVDEAFEIARDLPPCMTRAFVYSWRGWAAEARGELALAREMYHHNLDLGLAISHGTTTSHSYAFLARVDYAEGKYEDAFARFSDALRMHLEIGDGWGLGLDLEGFVCLAVARGRHADGVRLMGGVDAMRDRVGVALPATHAAERARLTAIARASLGAEFDRLYESGRHLSMEAVVSLATYAAGEHTAEYRVPTLDGAGGLPHAQRPAPPATTLKVLALGTLQVFIGDEAIDVASWGSARTRELLVYLLVHSDGRTKEQVGLAFWPEASSAQLRNNFHVTLHRLRKALRNPDWVLLANDRYRIDPAIVREFDVAEFEREVVAGRRALRLSRDGAAAALERALTRFRGDFLDGESVGDWHNEVRDRMQRLYVDACLDLGTAYVDEENWAKAAETYRRILARDEIHEEAARALMTCLVRLGERTQSLRLYQRLSVRLRQELDADPDEETTALYERVQRGEGF